MVPKGWLLCSAEDICESISVGIVIQPSKYYVSSSEGIRAFRSANVREGVINDSDWVYLSKEGHELNRKSQLLEGDVLIVRTGYPGTACVVTKDYEGSNAIDIVIARPDINKVMSEYLCFYTNSEIGKAQVLNLQGGMAQKHLNVGAYKELKVKLPPHPEQRKIAQILSTWDKAIATTERLLANKQQQKKALMQRLLTGKQRFAGFEGEWQDLTLTEVAQITMGSSPLSTAYNETGDGLPLIQGNADIKDRLSAPRIHTSQITKECFSDDVLLSVRAPVGTVAKSRHHACIGRGIAAIRAKGLLSQEYLYQLLLDFEPKWERLSQGSTFESVNSDDIKSLPVRLPCIKEQQTIASVLAKADSELSIIQKQLDNLKLQKKALMQQLLTGKRRVKVDEAAA